jgi:hypothetical protein
VSTFEEEKKIRPRPRDVADGDGLEPCRTRRASCAAWKVLVPLAVFFITRLRAPGVLAHGVADDFMLEPGPDEMGGASPWRWRLYLVFYKLLRVPLPPGLLKFPWA